MLVDKEINRATLCDQLAIWIQHAYSRKCSFLYDSLHDSHTNQFSWNGCISETCIAYIKLPSAW